MDARVCAVLVLIFLVTPTENYSEVPEFVQPIPNITISVGREAILSCIVKDLDLYKIAWLRVDTQTILTIQSHIITKNTRVMVKHTDNRSWNLHIRDVQKSDSGWYMCQINTDPMKSQVGYLEVVVPPDIVDHLTSTDTSVNEGSNVTMTCAATGTPTPSIIWRREAGKPIIFSNGTEVSSIEGKQFNITKVNRLHMGPYLCIASNGVPPSVSKRIMLIVNFAPMIWVQNQLVGAYESQRIILECYSEAYPNSINFWTRENGESIVYGHKYEPIFTDNVYKIHMQLIIKSVNKSDFGTYKCISKNSLGETDGVIKLLENVRPSTTTLAATTTQPVYKQKPKFKNISDTRKTTPTSGKPREYLPKTEINTLSRNPEVPVPDPNEKIKQKNKLATYLKEVPHSSSCTLKSIAVSYVAYLCTILFC